jgi:hypothetical protein
MSPLLDPTGDLADVVDGLEPVTVVCRGGGSATTVAHALRLLATTKEAAPSDAQYARSDLRWWLPLAECAAAPRLGDEILDAAGGRWTVLEVNGPGPTGRWQCACRNLAIAHGLDNFVTIEQAVYSKGSGGAALATWSTWRSGVPARIQPADAHVEAVLQANQAVKKYLIFIAEELALASSHRIKAPDGALYRVTGWNRAERIGELQTIEAERILAAEDQS